MSTGPKIVGVYLEPKREGDPGYIIIRDKITPEKIKLIKAAWNRQFKGCPKPEVRTLEGEYDSVDAFVEAIEVEGEGDL